MGLTFEYREALDELKQKIMKQYKIKYDSLFELDEDISDSLQKKEINNEYQDIIDMDIQRDDDNYATSYECSASNRIVVMKGDYFLYIKTSMLSENSSQFDRTIYWLFINSSMVKTFFNTYIKNEKPKYQRKPLTNGLYEIVDSLFGPQFSKLDISENEPPILKDGLEKKLKNEIQKFCDKEDIYKILKLDYKRGILLYGPPGNGKTSFIRNFAQELGAITVIASLNDHGKVSFLNDFLSGEEYKDRLKIVVFEDIDGFGSGKRSILLNMLDGVVQAKKTVFIATTNFPERLDVAIRNRPSRFDTIHKIGLPEQEERKKLLLRFFPEKEINGELYDCVEASEGFSGAYFKEVYIYAKLNDLTPLESIKILKDRMSSVIKDCEVDDD